MKMAVFRVEKTRDYLVMAKYHLKDRGLSLKSKGLLTIILSLPEEWDYTLAGLAHICKDGISSIRTTIMELEENGYLVRRRLRNEKGHFVNTEYIIHEKPTCAKVVDNSPAICEKPMHRNPILTEPTLEKRMLENCTQLNTNQSSKEKLNTDISNINQSIRAKLKSDVQEQKADEIDVIDRYRQIIKKKHRRCAYTDNVVYAHCHTVNTHGVVLIHC